MQLIGIIPARYASVRFPGKPLAVLAGKTVIQRVYEQVRAAEFLTDVIVATDDDRIAGHVQSFGGKAIMTRPDHISGTDRCAEVARQFPDDAIVVNVQGDEPFVQPRQIEAAARLIGQTFEIATLAREIEQADDLFSPHVVKVVADNRKRALYFSRQVIPFLRGVPRGEWLARRVHYQHIGLYAFRNACLQQLTQLSPGRLEQVEGLEQLRWMEAGFDIAVESTEAISIGIDLPEDILRAERWLEAVNAKKSTKNE